MSRPRMRRRLHRRYNSEFFKPNNIPTSELEIIELEHDELEALRLCDLEQKNQIDCALLMEVSQPTFHRLLLEARRKLSDAIINKKAIRIK